VIAAVDSTNPKVLKLFDVSNGKPLGNQIEHINDIKEFSLNNTDAGANRKIAFLDNNKDLFISPILKKDSVRRGADSRKS
jgi:intraflagellar transport protein 80